MKSTQDLFEGYDSYLNIKTIVETADVEIIMVVCDSSFKLFDLPIKQLIDSVSAEVLYFEITSSKSNYDDIKKGIKLFDEKKCEFIISIGTANTIDVAKCINIHRIKDDELTVLVNAKSPHLAMPTTAGGGNEAMQFATIYNNGKAYPIEYKDLLPDFVILDPGFLSALSMYQRKCFTLHALCQAIESVWTKKSTDESKKYALKAIKLILENLDSYLIGDRESRFLMLQASYLSGKAANISKTAVTHALSCKLSSRFGIPHGHAAALCLPYVWEHLYNDYLEHSKERAGEEMKNVFESLQNVIHTTNFNDAFGAIAGICIDLNLYYEFEYDDNTISELATSVEAQELDNHPVCLPRKSLLDIYPKILNNQIYQKKNKYLRLRDWITKEAARYKRIRKLQMYELDILLEVGRICRENNITYYLGEGTLLGAVRHNGFIPWDDDVDILMMREDYERFMEIAPKQLPPSLVLQNYKTTKRFFLFAAKVRMKDNTDFYQYDVANILDYNGPYIDIFPLDYVPQRTSPMQWFISKKVTLFRWILFYRSKVLKKPKNRKKLLAYHMRHFFHMAFLLNSIDKSIQKYNSNSKKRYVVNYPSYYDTVSNTFPNYMYGEPIFIDFEGHSMPVPSEYHHILTSIYGNYAILPPVSKRTVKHKFETR